MNNAVIYNRHLTPKGFDFKGHKKQRVTIELDYNTGWAKLIHKALKLGHVQLANYLFMKTFTNRHGSAAPYALTAMFSSTKITQKEMDWALSKAKKETNFTLVRSMLNKLVMLSQRSMKSNYEDWGELPLELELQSDGLTIHVDLGRDTFLEYCSKRITDFDIFRSLSRAQNLQITIKHTGRVLASGEVYV